MKLEFCFVLLTCIETCAVAEFAEVDEVDEVGSKNIRKKCCNIRPQLKNIGAIED